MLPRKCSVFCLYWLQHHQDATRRRSLVKKWSKTRSVFGPFHGVTDTLWIRTGFSLAPSRGGRRMLHYTHLMAVVSTHGLNHICNRHSVFIYFMSSKTWQYIGHLDHFFKKVKEAYLIEYTKSLQKTQPPNKCYSTFKYLLSRFLSPKILRNAYFLLEFNVRVIHFLEWNFHCC